jgi:hypothetical protein
MTHTLLARFLPSQPASQLYPFYLLRIRSLPIIRFFSILPAISCLKLEGEFFSKMLLKGNR